MSALAELGRTRVVRELPETACVNREGLTVAECGRVLILDTALDAVPVDLLVTERAS